MNKLMKTDPAVFAIGNEYQITVPVSADAIMWVQVGGENYYDDSNGILRSATRIHKIPVPQEALNEAGEYTVVYRKIIDRKPYFPELEDEVKTVYPFRPVRGGEVRAYHIADVHNKPEPAIAAGKFFGDSLDLLILNGDIPNHSGDVENFTAVYELAADLTHGTLPVVFARGNHDTRGFYAENFADYTPTQNGNSFFTFRVGAIWGIVLDCGEDKEDNHPEYGGTVACSFFRKKETAYLKDVIRRAEEEYLAPGVEKRIVVCHVPFPRTYQEPFNTEVALYTEWCRLLREEVKPDVMICGHEHTLNIYEVGGEFDHKGQPCPIVVGSRPYEQEDGSNGFQGAAITFRKNDILVQFNDHNGIVLEEHTLQCRN